MLQKYKTKREEGFTIIEVLIVLAIAGLIILIVFLAVPALQRNSRNTQRKEDASKLVGAINEWSNNNNGKLPATTTERNAAISNAQLSIYDGAVTWNTTWPVDANSVRIAVDNRCNGQNALTAQNRSVVVLYRVETAGAPVQQCTGS